MLRKTIKRSIKFSLDEANTGKKSALERLWEEYQKAVNKFLELLYVIWEADGYKAKSVRLEEETVKGYESELSYRYKQCAKRQAEGIFNAWLKRKKRTEKDKPPFYENVSMNLDQRFVEVNFESENSFDVWVKIAILEKGEPKWLPVKLYNYACEKYISKEEWERCKSVRVLKKNGKWFVEMTFEREIELPIGEAIEQLKETKNKEKREELEDYVVKKAVEIKEGKMEGIDIGYRKLIALSDGTFFGQETKDLIKKVENKEQNSKAEKRLREQVKNEMGQKVKEFFKYFLMIGGLIIFMEILKDLKKDKSGEWSSKVNRKFSFWTYSLLIKRITEQAELSGVHVLSVPAKYTSRTCPKCLYCSADNRNGEKFKCLASDCGYENDADTVGSLNVKSLGRSIIVSYAGKS